MRFPADGQHVPIRVGSAPDARLSTRIASDPPAGREWGPILFLDADEDPGVIVLTCANCGAEMDERKCKLICRCGYFLSCSDYY